MTGFSLELSDGIAELRLQLDPYCRETLVLEPGDARALQHCCDLLYRRAREMECELSRRIWNEQAAVDRIQEMNRVAEEIGRCGTNVTLFPVVPRPQPPRSPEGAA